MMILHRLLERFERDRQSAPSVGEVCCGRLVRRSVMPAWFQLQSHATGNSICRDGVGRDNHLVRPAKMIVVLPAILIDAVQ